MPSVDMEEVRPGGSLTGARSTAFLLELLARFSVWFPCVLTIYALFRWAKLPLLTLPALAAVLVIAWVVRSRRRGSAARLISSSPIDLAFLGLLLVVLAMPVLPSFRDAVQEGLPRFYNADEAYLLMVARGQAVSLPPPDLAWAGEENHYHQGGPLAVEGLSRATAISPASVFYGILPLLVRLAFVGGAWRFFEVLRPLWSLRRKLVCIAVACGICFVDPVAIAWNLRNCLKTRDINFETVFEGVPIAGHITLSGSETVSYGGPLADIFLLGAIANLTSAGPVVTGSALAAVYLTKAQTGVPAFAGLLGGGIFMFGLWRSKRLLMAVACAVPFLIFMRRLGPSVSSAGISIGDGANIRSLSRAGLVYASALRMHGSAAPAALGLLLWASHWLLPAAIACFFLWVVVIRPASEPRVLLIAALSAGLACLLFASVVVIRPKAELIAAFQETHSAVRTRLWLPYDDYLDRMFTEISASVSNSAVVLFVGLLAAGGIVELQAHTRRRYSRLMAAAAIALSLALFCASSWYAVVPGHQLALKEAKTVERPAIEALRVIPLHDGVVLTNELSFDAHTSRHLPLLNTWAPAVFGHQFWANDFMFNLDAPDLVQRFREQERFWNESPGDWGSGFLEREQISWILQRKDLPGPDLRRWGAVRVVFENDDYRVARVLAVFDRRNVGRGGRDPSR